MVMKNVNPVTNEIMNDKEIQHEAAGKQIRILVVDDHPLVHHELVRLINGQPGFTVCAETESTRLSLEILDKQQIDLAVVNISLGSTDCIRLAEEVRMRFPRVSVLTFSVSIYDELLYVKTFLQKGRSAYVVDQGATDQIMTAIRNIQSLLRSGVSGVTIRVEITRRVLHAHEIN